MEFTSIIYALFLIAVVAFYYSPWAIRASWRQNILLLAVSYIFYGAWDWRYLSLILITTLTTYGTAIAIERTRRRLWLVANIVVNIGILVTFKYFNFFSENLAWLMKWVGWEMDWFTLDVLLPVGISFYTFQAIGYSIDVWRGDIKPTHNLLLFATFIAFFPQLIAGPIERSMALMPQLARVNRWNYREGVQGLRFILWGLVKKVAVADPCGAVADTWYGDTIAFGPIGFRVYLAGLLFMIQVYCDFSGYCDIATGSARLLGVKLSMNFDRPLISRNFLELWNRWHITLTRWFTDYVYIPLGGSRKGRCRTYANVMVVFLLSGLWHGAGWGFVIWGAMSGVIFCFLRYFGFNNYRHAASPTLRDLPAIFATLQTFAITTMWVRLSQYPEVALDCMWRYAIPISLLATVVFRMLFDACRKTAIMAFHSRETDPQLCRRLYFGFMGAIFIVLVTIAPDIALTHLYVWTIFLCYGCEWATRSLPWGDCPFPLPCRKAPRLGLYMLLYMLILTYGLLRMPPVVDATTFLYFQF